MAEFEVNDRALVTSDSYFGAITIIRSVDTETRTVTASLPWGYEKTFSFDELKKVVRGMAAVPPETRLTALRKMFMGDSLKTCAKFLEIISGDKGKDWVEWLKEVRTVDDEATKAYESTRYRPLDS